MRIALGGSAANPAHYGHKQLVEAILQLGQFDRVLWIVSGERPDKQGLPDSFYRWQMAQKLGIDPKIEISYERGVATPTIEVVRKMQKDFPRAEIIWYGGSDHFVAKEKFNGLCDVEAFWHAGAWLMENQPFLIAPRRGMEKAVMRYPKNFSLVDVVVPEISSTLIRQRFKEGLDNSRYTTQAVLDYMARNKLYTKGASL